jgi:hypothetical protein
MQDETRVLEMDKYEYGVVFHSLNDKRNELLREQRSTDAVDEVLLKVIDAPSKKEKKNIDRGER